MIEPNKDVLVDLVQTHVKQADIDEAEPVTIPVDPACVTYRLGDYWIKVLRTEAKNPKYTPLHREFFALDQVDRLNRKTVDIKLHVPLPRPIAVESPNPETIERGHLLAHAIEGTPLLRLVQSGDMTGSLREKLGEQIGRYLARVHSVQLKGCGLLTSEGIGVHPGPWMKYFGLIIDAQWEHLKKSGFLEAGLLQKTYDAIQTQRGLLMGESMNLVHNDFQLMNIWVDAETAKVTGILNFTQAGVGSAAVDLASFFVHCPDTNFYKDLENGYENVRALPGQIEPRLAMYALIFGLRAAFFFDQRGDEAKKGYYIRRALEAGTVLDGGLSVEASKYSSYEQPV